MAPDARPATTAFPPFIVPSPDGLAVPGIPVSAGAMVFDRAGRLLILNPTYKSGWTVPGGVMEADGETPWDACRREVREECGIEVQRGELACMDFRRPKPGRPGGIRFLFDCGQLSDETLAGIVLQAEEISGYQLAALPDALGLLRLPGGAHGVQGGALAAGHQLDLAGGLVQKQVEAADHDDAGPGRGRGQRGGPGVVHHVEHSAGTGARITGPSGVRVGGSGRDGGDQQVAVRSE